jgi:methyl-accepting chemotaxis protein
MQKMKFRAGFISIFSLNVLAWLAAFALIFTEQGKMHQGLLASVGIGLFALWCFASVLLLRRVDQHAGNLLLRMQALSAGRLDKLSEQDASNAFEQAIGTTEERMRDVVTKVRNGTAGFAQTSGLLSNDNKALAERTEKQSALLEETAASTEEITATVRQNADNAEKANQLIASAADAAGQGGDVVNEVEKTMAAIRDSSRKIADIISVVDSIAFQTNILALNAAVEAARAGDVGSGFAVVAAEVRVLAQRVAAASKEIQILITDSVDKVETCDKQVLLANATMRKIVTLVKSAATVMHEISSSSREQSIGVENINSTISQIDQMTQENSKLVDEIAASAVNLHRQAVTLTNVVSHFQLGSNEFGNKEDAVFLVDSAVHHAETAGLADMLDKVNDLVERQFADRDLYLVIVTLNGEIIAHGGNPRLLKIDARKQRDPDGKAFGLDIVNVAKTQGTGWVDFKFAHPVTQEIKAKSAYVRRMSDCIISCGFYRM